MGELKYRIEISQIPATGSKSVIVDYPDLERFDTDLSTSLVKAPEQFLEAFDGAAVETLNVENPIYADSAGKEIRIRIRDLPDRLSLRGVTKDQLNTLIQVAGMVTRTSESTAARYQRCLSLHQPAYHLRAAKWIRRDSQAADQMRN